MRSCLFCPNDVDSAEHGWPEWLLDSMPGSRERVTSVTRGPDDPERDIRGTPFRIRCVCRTCNNHWMSDLETSTKPLLIRMMQGERTVLTPLQSSLVATWMVKTAMVFDAARAHKRRWFTRKECEYARRSQLPASGMLAWIGCMATPVRLYTEGRALWTDLPKPGHVFEGSATTIAFGHAVLQLLAVRLKVDARSSTLTIKLDGFRPKGRHLLEIWPGRDDSIVWPPPDHVPSPSELEKLAHRFGPSHNQVYSVPSAAKG